MKRLKLKKYPVTYDNAEFLVKIKDKPTWINSDYSSFPELLKRTHVYIYKVDTVKVFDISIKKHKKLYHKYYRDPITWEGIRKDDDMYINLAKKLVKREYSIYKSEIDSKKEELFRRANFECWKGEIE